MLKGKSIQLRPILQADLPELYSHHIEIANRGEFFPLNILSESEFQRRFEQTGYWEKESGMLVIMNGSGAMIGHIEFFRTVSYLDEMELSYQIYGQAERGQGYATQAVNLLTRYLFGCLKVNRIRLIIHPENCASRRVAEKCGFVLEGIARQAWYHQGKNHDVAVYAILRQEVTAVH